MFSRSLYFRGGGDPLAMLAEGLGIRSELCLDFEAASTDYSFFRRKENALFFSEVAGDFQFAADVYLFDVDSPEFEEKLIRASVVGLVVALPDESVEHPFGFILFEAGQRTKIDIVEDEETEAVRIYNSSSEKE